MVETEVIYLFYQQWSPLSLREKGFKEAKQSQVIFIKSGTIPESNKLFYNNCTFISPFYTFPYRET